MRLLENFWLKVIAVVMGFFVWLHVATEKTYDHRLWLPVTEVTLKDSLTLSLAPPDSLLVEVSANGKQLLRKKWRERGLRINASQYKAGRYAVVFSTENTSLAGPSGDISLDEIMFPRQAELHIDHLAAVSLPVTANIDAEPDDGFAVHRIYITDPETVELSGPRSTLGRFETVFTENKRLSALRNSISLTMQVMIPQGYGYSVKPDSVTVKVDVVPVKTRTYEDLPVVVYNSPPGLAVGTDPRAVHIELTGPPEDIDLLNRNAITVSVDYRQMTIDSLAALKVDCPSSFRVKRQSIDTARIIIESNADAGN